MVTIRISDTTKQLLDSLKQEEHATSYDEIIRQLLEKELKIPKSMFGAMPGFHWTKEEDRIKCREL